MAVTALAAIRVGADVGMQYQGDFTKEASMQRGDLLGLMGARRGHFMMESGHHGELWLDLDGLFCVPSKLDDLFDQLAVCVSRFDPDMVCGPLTGGAFTAYALASRLGSEFRWTDREHEARESGLFPYRYDLVGNRPVAGQRVLVVDDVINAGSATHETLRLLHEQEAVPVALAALLTLGDGPSRLARDQGLDLVALAATANNLWSPAECPLCSGGYPID